MKRYEAQSSHELGYRWTIKAPEALSLEDLQALQEALCDYTDAPDNAQLQEMLEDKHYCENLQLDKLELFKQVQISVEAVHRETFTQGLSETA